MKSASFAGDRDPPVSANGGRCETGTGYSSNGTHGYSSGTTGGNASALRQPFCKWREYCSCHSQRTTKDGCMLCTTATGYCSGMVAVSTPPAAPGSLFPMPASPWRAFFCTRGNFSLRDRPVTYPSHIERWQDTVFACAPSILNGDTRAVRPNQATRRKPRILAYCFFTFADRIIRRQRRQAQDIDHAGTRRRHHLARNMLDS